jgi:mannose-6-phosphate isomerase-like protein (cupin superfamily)
MDSINIRRKLTQFNDHWHPRIVGQINDMYVKLAKIQGAFVWHSHRWEDEMFYVVSGRLTMRYRDRDVEVAPGEFVIVPHGVEHLPVCDEETHILLIEPKATVNTGDADSDRQVASDWI